MEPFVIKYKMRTANKNKDSEEMIFEIKTKGEIDLKIIDELLKVNGVISVNWISESGDIMS